MDISEKNILSNDYDIIKETLIFNFKFNKEISVDIINKSIDNKIKKIIFNNYKNDDINLNSLMTKRLNEYFLDYDHNPEWRGNRFNKSINDLYILDIEHLILGVKFNQSVSNLPNTLRSLVLSFEFDKPLDNLPNNLELLCLGCCIKYSQNLDYLPESLTHLTVPSNFTHNLDNLPQSLKILDLSKTDLLTYYTITILPNSLKYILIKYSKDWDKIVDLYKIIKNNNNESIQIIYKENNNSYNIQKDDKKIKFTSEILNKKTNIFNSIYS